MKIVIISGVSKVKNETFFCFMEVLWKSYIFISHFQTIESSINNF